MTESVGQWLTIEGNIGSGKSELLRAMEGIGVAAHMYPERVNRWKDVLERYYEDPSTHGLALQATILFDMVLIQKAHKVLNYEERAAGRPVLPLVTERSPWSGRYLFAPVMRQLEYLTLEDAAAYDAWVSSVQFPDHVVYVRSDPETCLMRVRGRDRPQERAMTLEYLTLLHQRHESAIQKLVPPRQLTVLDARDPTVTTEALMVALMERNPLGLFGTREYK